MMERFSLLGDIFRKSLPAVMYALFHEIPVAVCLFLLCFPWSVSSQQNFTTKANLTQDSVPHGNLGALMRQGSTASDGDYVDSEILRKALINHTLSHGGHEDLDHLIFSSIPEGSKLVLQSVKVMQTDGEGNPLPHLAKNSPVHWNVKITNASTEEPHEDAEDDEEEDNEEVEEDEQEDKRVLDLASSGSHAEAKYKAYGEQEREKEKIHKQYMGNDRGKTHKITHTDTDGKKVTNYKGKEDGITDYDNKHGHANKNEGERYRDTKKKNKGRRVSGFKRVYHKEEFQRTEHFYDDEDAKRIAESYGMKDAKENANHGKKDDDRKYHGKKTEYTDGKKITDEKGTSNGFNNGHRNEYKDSEKHRLNSHYSKSQSHGSPSNNNPAHNDHHGHQHHPSHNYHGSYSQARPRLQRPQPNNYHQFYMNFKPGYIQTNFKPSSNPLDHPDAVAVMSKIPMTASYVLSEPDKDSLPASSTDVPTVFRKGKLRNSRKSMNPNMDIIRYDEDEVRMYYSPKKRVVSENAIPTESPKPPPQNSSKSKTKPHLPVLWNPYPYSHDIFGNGKLGNSTTTEERNGKRLSSPKLVDGYSTLVKMPTLSNTNYIHLDDEDGVKPAGTRYNQTAEEDEEHETQDDSNPPTKGKPNPPTFPPYPRHRPGPSPKGRWFSLSIGDPDMINDVHTINHPHPHRKPPHFEGPPRPPHPPPMGMSKIMRGVKNKLWRPPRKFPPPPLPPGRYDTSKYPPNVVVVDERGKSRKSNNGSPINKLAAESGRKSVDAVKAEEDEEEDEPEVEESPQYSGERDRGPGPPSRNLGPGPSPHSPGHGPLPNMGHNRTPTNRYKMPHPLPPFINNLMDSVANFFGNMG